MKKFLVIGLYLLMSTCIPIYQARAEGLSLGDTLKKIPALDNGGYYSLIDSVFNYSATFKVLQTKNENFALNFGYAGRAKETKDKIIVTGSAKLLKLKDYVNVPILDLVVFEPYLCIGFGRINLKVISNSEFDFGVGANILKVSW